MALGLPDISGAATGEVVYAIKLAGQDLPGENGLLSLVVERTMNKIASANLIVQDDDTGDEPYALSNQAFTKPGSEVEITAGYGEETETIFKGIIVSQRMKIDKRRSVMILECKDKAVKMTMIKKSAYFYEMKDSDVWSQLIADAGLTAESEATTVTHKEMVQYNATDWDFMLCRAEANSMLAITTDGTIKLMKPVASGTAVVTAKYGDNVFEFDADMDARTQLKNVAFSAWDAAAQEMAKEESAEPSMVSNGDVTGEDLSKAVSDKPFTITHSGKIDTDEMKSFADAKLTKSRLAKMRGRVKVQGTAAVKPGDVVTLDGFGDRFNGDVMATAVRHEIVKGNWLTDIQFGGSANWYAQDATVNDPPAASMLPAIQGLQIGVVTALESDPEGENRIKVKIPVISADEEGIWTRQATLDAGDTRGWVIRPEIGDEVIVGFINNDPREAVVLGSLHSSAKAPPIPGKDDNHEKGWTTRSGIKILVDDDKKIIEISTPAGNKLVMDEDQKKITITDQNNNSIEMSSDGVKIESAKDIILKATGDIKAEGINIENKASAAFKAEGSGSAELKSSGQTTVKGSMVMIN
ncbi:MAG: type VI secretion system tip protein VgrG [Bacteroidota bacterium]